MSEQLKPQADIGVTYIYKQDFWAGFAYRTSGAIIANLGVNIRICLSVMHLILPFRRSSE